MQKKKLILLAFATLDLKKSIKRLKKQAIQSNYYNDIKIFTPQDLDLYSKNKIKEIFKSGKKKGYGYWFWKPYLVSKLIKEINENDIIHYLDIGCHINNFQNNKFQEYIDFLSKEENNLLTFQYYPLDKKKYTEINFPEMEEYKYTKADLLNHFQFMDNKQVTHTGQYWAGSFFIKKNKFTEIFIKDWLEIFEKKFNLIDDSTSKINNFIGFIENRHDQSVFSLLCKKNSIKSFSAYECDWALKANNRTWAHIEKNPILAKRDLQYGILRRFLNRQKKNFNRLKKNYSINIKIL